MAKVKPPPRSRLVISQEGNISVLELQYRLLQKNWLGKPIWKTAAKTYELAENNKTEKNLQDIRKIQKAERNKLINLTAEWLLT